MANHLGRVFARTDLIRFYKKPEIIGDERYEVVLPFVFRKEDRVLKAIKPLDLDKPTSTKVYEHGDQWINRVKRLREIGRIPEQFLFPVRYPATGEKRKAAGTEVVKELERLDVKVVPFASEQEVVAFARVT